MNSGQAEASAMPPLQLRHNFNTSKIHSGLIPKRVRVAKSTLPFLCRGNNCAADDSAIEDTLMSDLGPEAGHLESSSKLNLDLSSAGSHAALFHSAYEGERNMPRQPKDLMPCNLLAPAEIKFSSLEEAEAETGSKERDKRIGFNLDSSDSKLVPFLQLSLGHKRGGLEEVFKEESAPITQTSHQKDEREVWLVGKLTVGYSLKLIENKDFTLKWGSSVTMHEFADRELREAVGQNPVTVLTNIRVDF